MTKKKAALLFYVFFGLVAISLLIFNIPMSKTSIFEDITPEAVFDRELSFTLLDVRTPAEFEAGHIFGATNIDFKSPTFEEEIAKLDRNRTYLVYCKSGGRSKMAVDKMSLMGFAEVYNMQGGITEWVEEGFSVIKGD